MRGIGRSVVLECEGGGRPPLALCVEGEHAALARAEQGVEAMDGDPLGWDWRLG